MQKQRVRILYILPSRYDDEGYVHRYCWGVLPSNTLSCLESLTLRAVESGALGNDLDVKLSILDDSVHVIRPEKIVQRARRNGEKLLVGFVGVQSNQFPRAADLAAIFREHDVPVLLGGFHVSGVLALFDEPDDAMQRLMDRGVAMVAGEVEEPGLLADILRDGIADNLQSLYRAPATPSITNAPIPTPNPAYINRFVGKMGTMDTSRGCPFNCSFCTIINVQGRTMRHRSAQCMLDSIKAHYDMGIIYYFFTDDNFSRSPVWKELFDGLVAMRAQGIDVQFMMQVDTQAWRIPGFIEAAVEAGCYQVFIGIESINEANLKEADKRQNKVHQYADMVDAWRSAKILVHCGYIIGFAHDDEDSVRRDLAILRDEFKVDEASFFMLTPLPGSRDHKNMCDKGVPIDADLNNLDSFHETFRHPKFAPGRWRDIYIEAWGTFYAKENITNVLLRTPPERYWRMFWLSLWNRYATLKGTHTMITGFIRRKDRRSRRPWFKQESRRRYAWRRTRDLTLEAKIIFQLFLEYQEIWLLTRPGTKKNPLANALQPLHDAWLHCRRRIADANAVASIERASQEVIALLRSAGQTIVGLSKDQSIKSKRVRQRLAQLGQELEIYLDMFRDAPPSRENLDEAKSFVEEELAEYETLAVAPVARRRRCNAYHREFARHLKEKTLSPRLLLGFPRAIWDEALLGAHFASAFLHAKIHALRVVS